MESYTIRISCEDNIQKHQSVLEHWSTDAKYGQAHTRSGLGPAWRVTEVIFGVNGWQQRQPSPFHETVIFFLEEAESFSG